jgi:hypothetical protein
MRDRVKMWANRGENAFACVCEQNFQAWLHLCNFRRVSGQAESTSMVAPVLLQKEHVQWWGIPAPSKRLAGARGVGGRVSHGVEIDPDRSSSFSKGEEKRRGQALGKQACTFFDQ